MEMILRMAGNSSDEIVFAEEDDLLADFLTWTNDAVAEMRGIVDDLPDQIARGTETVHRIYDLTHNIKGMGASFMFNLLTDVGVSLCGHLKGMDDDTLVSRRVFESHIRAFEVILEHKIKGSGGEQGTALTRRLEAIIQEETHS